MVRRLKILAVSVLLSVGLMAHPGTAQASEVGVGEAILIGVTVIGVVGALNLTSIVASSVYLGMKKHSPLGWQIFGYGIGGITLGVGVAYAAGSGSADLWAIAGIGATTLTLSILAGTLNKAKKKPAVALSPVLIRDMQGQIRPGLGLSVLAF